MMRLIENIRDIYNQHQFVTTHSNVVSVLEQNNADTKQIDIFRANTDFYLLSQSFYKGQPNITTDKSNLLRDKDCDGVIFYEDQHAEQYLLGVELKSGFSDGEIKGGYSQIIYTFLKIYTLLSICNDFDFGKYKMTAYLACQPIKDKAEESRIVYNLHMKQMAGDAFSISDNVIYNYIFAPQKEVRLKIKDIGLIKRYFKQNISQDILNQEIIFRLYTVPMYGDHQGRIVLP